MRRLPTSEPRGHLVDAIVAQRVPDPRAFDDPNLVSCAGLVPVMRLAQACDLHGLLAKLVWIGTSIGSNPAGKMTAIVAGMVTGADSIDDLDVVRHGGMSALFGGCYAPSTLGSFLREFGFGHTRQLGAAARKFLINLAEGPSTMQCSRTSSPGTASDGSRSTGRSFVTTSAP